MTKEWKNNLMEGHYYNENKLKISRNKYRVLLRK